MDKYDQYIDEIKATVKKDFMVYFDKKLNGRGYYNWTESDDTIIEMTIRETWRKPKPLG